VLFVASYVSTAFYLPEFSPGFRNDFAPSAFVTVPEAAVHENNGAVFRENNIGLTRQVFSVKAVSVPKSVKDRANPHLGIGIPAFYRSHVSAALFRTMNVCHDQAIPERLSRSLNHCGKARNSEQRSSLCRRKSLVKAAQRATTGSLSLSRR